MKTVEKNLKCDSCHKQRDRLHDCNHCHRNVCIDCQPHYTAVSDTCAECHTEKQLRFK